MVRSPNNDTTHLHHLMTLTLPPTSGVVTIARAQDVFPGYIADEFGSWGTDRPGADTEKAFVEVFEVIENGTYEEILYSLGVDLRTIRLSQGQIVEFCRLYPDHLRQDGYGTYIPFAVGEGDAAMQYMMCAYLFEGKLEANIDYFEECDPPLYAGRRHRLVCLAQK